MKHILAFIHKTNDLVLVAICMVLLLIVMIIVITNLWPYVILCFAVLLYFHKSKGIRFMKNIHTKTEKKS